MMPDSTDATKAEAKAALIRDLRDYANWLERWPQFGPGSYATNPSFVGTATSRAEVQALIHEGGWEVKPNIMDPAKVHLLRKFGKLIDGQIGALAEWAGYVPLTVSTTTWVPADEAAKAEAHEVAPVSRAAEEVGADG